MAYFQKLLPQTLQSLAFGSISGTYATLGTVNHDARIIKIVNDTDQAIIVSWDGLLSSAGNDYVPANGFTLYDLTTNRVQDDGAFIGVGTVFSIKQAGATSPTLNAVYLVVIYTQVR